MWSLAGCSTTRQPHNTPVAERKSLPQKWLSLTSLAMLLGTSEDHVKWLAKNGFLVFMWGDRKMNWDLARYLDPTPEYAEKLKRGEVFYERMYPGPNDIDNVPLISTAEIAEILGMRIGNVRRLLSKWPAAPVKGYYSVEQVRQMLGRRSRSAHRSPFLIMELVRFFWRRNTEGKIPAREEYGEDDVIFRKLQRITQMPHGERQEALLEFFSQVKVAKEVAHSLPTPP